MNQFIGLQKYLQQLENEIKDGVPVLTGELKESIVVRTAPKKYGVMVEVEMYEYGYYQNEGVDGVDIKYGSQFSYRDKMPPEYAFKAYSSDRNVRWAIANSIYHKGIRPKRFITNEMLDKAYDNIADLTMEDLWKDKNFDKK